MEKIHAKAKTIWLVGTKHASDKQYTPLDGQWYWNRKICAAKCRLAKDWKNNTTYQPLKFVYAGENHRG